MSRWFRHYAGMMRDDKLVSVAIKAKQPVERVVWIWGAILESASEMDDGGLFHVDPAEIAYFLRTDEADVCAVLDALAAAGRVAEDRVVRWGDRQFQSDRSAERQAKYRDKRRSEKRDSDDQSPSGDGEVTVESRHGDAPETDTETEEETERDNTSISLEAEREFEAWYSAFPKHVGKGQARRSYRAARRKTPAETLMAGAARASLAYSGVDPKFIPHPATWLNGERWLDVDTEPDRERYDPSGDPVYKGVL